MKYRKRGEVVPKPLFWDNLSYERFFSNKGKKSENIASLFKKDVVSL
jgi:hypothetical protein